MDPAVKAPRRTVDHYRLIATVQGPRLDSRSEEETEGAIAVVVGWGNLPGTTRLAVALSEADLEGVAYTLEPVWNYMVSTAAEGRNVGIDVARLIVLAARGQLDEGDDDALLEAALEELERAARLREASHG